MFTNKQTGNIIEVVVINLEVYQSTRDCCGTIQNNHSIIVEIPTTSWKYSKVLYISIYKSADITLDG